MADVITLARINEVRDLADTHFRTDLVALAGAALNGDRQAWSAVVDVADVLADLDRSARIEDVLHAINETLYTITL